MVNIMTCLGSRYAVSSSYGDQEMKRGGEKGAYEAYSRGFNKGTQ